MSKIPFLFRTIPDEFLSDDFIDDPSMMKIIRYILKRINSKSHIEKIKSNGWHNVSLQPFEFVFGREMCTIETDLSHQIIKTRIERLITSSFIQKVTSRSTSSFTVYRLMTESFKQIGNQQINQQFNQQLDQQFIDKSLEINDSILVQKQRNKETKSPVLCLKETSKEKIVHNSVVSLSLSNNEREQEEDIEAFQAYFDHLGIIIDRATIRRWLKFGKEKLQNTIALMMKSKVKIGNPGGWIQNALKNNLAQLEQFREINKEFIFKFKAVNKIDRIKINKNYCVDTCTGNDYQFNLHPEMFKTEVERKFLG